MIKGTISLFCGGAPIVLPCPTPMWRMLRFNGEECCAFPRAPSNRGAPVSPVVTAGSGGVDRRRELLPAALLPLFDLVHHQ